MILSELYQQSRSIMTLSEFINPVACYFHGSTVANLRMLKTRESNLIGEPVVFAAILPEIAIAMSGHWTDDDFDFGHNTDAKHQEIIFKPYVMKEKRAGAFEKFFRQISYIYELPASYFEAHESLQDFEVVSYSDVPSHAVIKVDDALAYLEGSPALKLIHK